MKEVEAEVDQKIEKENCVVKSVVKNIQKQEKPVYAIYQDTKEKEKCLLMVVKCAGVMDAMTNSILMIHIQAALEVSQKNRV